MRLGKIALWVFVALLVSGIMFGASVASDVNKAGGWNNVFNGKVVLGFGEEYTVDDVKEADLTGIRRIQIDMTSTDTSVIIGEGRQVKASLKGQVRTTDPDAVPKLKIEVKGDTLYIAEVRTARVVTSFSSNLKLEVTIPDAFKEDLVFHGSSGRFTAEDLHLNTVNVNTTSGDIQLGNLSVAADFKASSSSGRCQIGDLSAKTVSIESTSGDKEVKSITAEGNISFSASSGETTADRLTGSQITIQTSSGDVKLGSLSAEFTRVSGASAVIRIEALEGDCEVKNSSGDVTVGCTSPTDKIAISTASGRVQLSLPDDSSFKLDATTNSGNIRSQFDLDGEKADEDYLRGTHNGGNIDVRVSTSSGDISINKN
jgi:DUF4097 and DUF4098 domain-containing protein YvlB